MAHDRPVLASQTVALRVAHARADRLAAQLVAAHCCKAADTCHACVTTAGEVLELRRQANMLRVPRPRTPLSERLQRDMTKSRY